MPLTEHQRWILIWDRLHALVLEIHQTYFYVQDIWCLPKHTYQMQMLFLKEMADMLVTFGEFADRLYERMKALIPLMRIIEFPYAIDAIQRWLMQLMHHGIQAESLGRDLQEVLKKPMQWMHHWSEILTLIDTWRRLYICICKAMPRLSPRKPYTFRPYWMVFVDKDIRMNIYERLTTQQIKEQYPHKHCMEFTLHVNQQGALDYCTLWKLDE